MPATRAGTYQTLPAHHEDYLPEWRAGANVQPWANTLWTIHFGDSQYPFDLPHQLGQVYHPFYPFLSLINIFL